MNPYYDQSGVSFYLGESLEVLRQLPDESVNCCITSPPYFGLRSYGIPPSIWGGNLDCKHEWEDASWVPTRWGAHDDETPGDKQTTNAGSLGHRGQAQQCSSCILCGAWLGCLGMERTPKEFVAHIVELFTQVNRVLRSDGTLWLNLGDSFANDGKWGGKTGGKHANGLHGDTIGRARRDTGLRPKDLIGIPWRCAFALQEAGWWLRSEIIWSKPNAFPESVSDRPTKSHEHIFLLTKAQKYFYDADAIKEPASQDTHARYQRGRSDTHKWADGGPGNQSIAKSFEHMRKNGVHPKAAEPGSGIRSNTSFSAAVKDVVEFRNKRSVWEVPSHPFPEAHFATFPPALIRPAVLAGCPLGGTILDPFSGAGTTAMVAKQNGRKCIGIELNEDYLKMSIRRVSQEVLDFQETA